MQVMVTGKAAEQKDDPDDAKKHGPRLGQITRVVGPEGARELTVELFHTVDSGAIVLGRNKAAAYTFLEEQCYRIVAPDMLVYLMKPLDAVCHGKVGKVWGWIDAPTRMWMIDVSGVHVLATPDECVPVLARGMIAALKEDRSKFVRLDSWDELQRIWRCFRVGSENDNEPVFYKCDEILVELAPGMASKDKTNGALVELIRYDTVARNWVVRPLAKPDWGGNLALVDHAADESTSEFTRDAIELEALHHKGDTVQVVSDKQHKGKVFILQDWDFHKGMWLLKDKNTRRRQAHAFSACCGIETVAADMQEERQPNRTDAFVSDNVKTYANRSDPDNPFYVCVIVMDRKDVSGPLRITVEEAEKDHSKLRGIMLTRGQDAAMEWLNAEKEKAKAFVGEVKAANKAAKKGGKPEKEDSTYRGPWTLDELAKLSVGDLKARCRILNIPDVKVSGISKKELATEVFKAMPAKPTPGAAAPKAGTKRGRKAEKKEEDPDAHKNKKLKPGTKAYKEAVKKVIYYLFHFILIT